MNSDQKQKEAEQLIDGFAAKLLALNDGNKIPTDWDIRLKMALTPQPKKTGRKRDYGQVAKVVKQLTLNVDKVRKPRTKHHNPRIIKDEIAIANKTSRKTVERIDGDRPEYMSELGRLNSLEPQLREAYIDGIAAAASEEIRREDTIEDKVNEQATRRRFPRLFPPEK